MTVNDFIKLLQSDSKIGNLRLYDATDGKEVLSIMVVTGPKKDSVVIQLNTDTNAG